jgi:hypothetical protein
MYCVDPENVQNARESLERIYAVMPSAFTFLRETHEMKKEKEKEKEIIYISSESDEDIKDELPMSTRTPLMNEYEKLVGDYARLTDDYSKLVATNKTLDESVSSYQAKFLAEKRLTESLLTQNANLRISEELYKKQFFATRDELAALKRRSTGGSELEAVKQCYLQWTPLINSFGGDYVKFHVWFEDEKKRVDVAIQNLKEQIAVKQKAIDDMIVYANGKYKELIDECEKSKKRVAELENAAKRQAIDHDDILSYDEAPVLVGKEQ